ncbi:hypothetical protein E4U21_003625 [Claviceps maximensis]|nr:hypothetical protein E4U21_003625 [Claviceps maximensis]
MSRNQNSSSSCSHVPADGAPPPPYSATDMHSNSPTRPRFTPLDNAAALPNPSSSSLSSSSTGSHVIYTPPLTPCSPSHEIGPSLQQDVEECVTSLRGLSVDTGHSGTTGLGDKNGISTSRTGGTTEKHDAGKQDGDAGPASRQTAGPESDQTYSQASLGRPSPPAIFSGSFRGSAGWSRAGLGQDSDTGGVHHRCHVHDGHDDQHDRCRDERRGRGLQAPLDEKRQRTSSASSTSSSVASKSSASSSIGSLPGYNDIEEHQLPLYVERLHDWAAHPDQIRTKHDVQRLKAELKTAARSQPGTTSKNDPVAAVDKRALKKQIKALHAQWKAIKKAQKQTRRAHKRERRQRRRAEKRERRQRDRAMKRASRNLRKMNPGPSSGVPMPMPVPVLPPAVPVTATTPAMPSVPPVFRAPTAASEHMPGNPGFRRGCGGARTERTSSFFRSDEPFGPQGRACERRRHFLDERAPAFFDCGRAGGRPRNDIPGAWPDDNAAQVLAPGPVSAAKYQAAEQLDAEMNKMAIRTASLGAGAEKLGLENAIQALARNRDKLRMEADEAYARALADNGAWD